MGIMGMPNIGLEVCDSSDPKSSCEKDATLSLFTPSGFVATRNESQLNSTSISE